MNVKIERLSPEMLASQLARGLYQCQYVYNAQLNRDSSEAFESVKAIFGNPLEQQHEQLKTWLLFPDNIPSTIDKVKNNFTQLWDKLHSLKLSESLFDKMFMWAARNGDTAAFMMLSEYPQIEKCNLYWMLIIAVDNQHFDAAKLLLERYPELASNYSDDIGQETYTCLLRAAAEHGQMDIIRLLFSPFKDEEVSEFKEVVSTNHVDYEMALIRLMSKYHAEYRAKESQVYESIRLNNKKTLSELSVKAKKVYTQPRQPYSADNDLVSAIFLAVEKGYFDIAGILLLNIYNTNSINFDRLFSTCAKDREKLPIFVNSLYNIFPASRPAIASLQERLGEEYVKAPGNTDFSGSTPWVC